MFQPDAEAQAQLRQTLESAKGKLETSMRSGPMEFGGEECKLTSEEATLVFRLLFERNR